MTKGAAKPRYRFYAAQLLSAIDRGRLEPGLVLLEGPISSLFRTSRATVRSALAFLAEQGRIERFNGRGFVVPVSGNGLIRREIVEADIKIRDIPVADSQAASDLIIEDVQKALSLAVAFGHYRINEQRLADSYAVSRPIAREVLWRLRESGLVEKDHHSPWLVGPLTARTVAEDRELLMLLEPHALKYSAPFIKEPELRAMCQRLKDARASGDKLGTSVIEQIENDLHVACLRHFPNSRIWAVIRKGRMSLLVNTLFAQFVGIERDDPGISEHAVVLDQIVNGEFEAAAASHTAHLRLEGRRTLDRLKVLSVIQEPPLPSYLERIV